MLTELEFNKNRALKSRFYDYADYMNQMNEMNTTQSDNTQDGDKFNFMDYLPFGSKSISGSIMRGIGQYMPDMDPRQKNLNQFYDVNNGTIQSGLMKDYNPVSGGLFGTPINYGLQDAYQKRIDTINKTIRRKSAANENYDDTELTNRRNQLSLNKINESMMLDNVNENTAYKNELGDSYSGGDTTTNVAGQNITSYNDPFDPGGGEKDGGFIDGSNRRTDYMEGGRAGYFFGGRIGFAGGGMDMGNEENQAQSAAIGTGTPGPGDTGGEGGDNPSDDSDTQFSGGDNPPTNIGNPFGYEDNAPPTNVRNPFGYQDNIMESVLSSRMNKYGEDMEEDINNPYSMENMFGITSQVPENMKLAKVFNTKEDLINLGAAKDTFFNTLTPKGEVLDTFRKNATSMNQGDYYKGLGAESQLNQLLQNKNKNATENEAVIRDALEQGFLNNQSDFDNQKPFNKAFAKGGRAMFKNGGLASIL